jgi:iron complex outermembrane receptor protein
LAPGPQTGTGTADTRSISGFAEVGYKFTDQLKIVLGGRYTDDHKKGLAVDVGATQGSPAFTTITAHQKGSWSAFTPKVTLEFTPTGDALFYATVSKGYVGGGFLRAGPSVQPGPTLTLAQAIAANIAGLQTPFNPEYATNYEIGAKTSWFDHRLIANVSVYRENFKDLQVTIAVPLPNGQVLRQAGNAGRTRTQGLDLEVQAAPAPWLRLGATYSYTDAKYLEFSTQGVNRAGNSLPNAPKNSLNLSAATDWDFDWGTLSAGGDISFRSKTFGDESNSDAPQVLDKTRIRGLVNGSIDFKMRDRHWDLRLWGRNLTDTRYGNAFSLFLPTVRVFGFAGTIYSEVLWNEPRTFGATVTYNLQ